MYFTNFQHLDKYAIHTMTYYITNCIVVKYFFFFFLTSAKHVTTKFYVRALPCTSLNKHNHFYCKKKISQLQER